jgi:hypothetical protein
MVKASYPPSVVLLLDLRVDGLDVWSGSNKNDVIPVMPDAPKYQNDGSPQVSLHHWGRWPRGPPLYELDVGCGLQANLSQQFSADAHNLTGYYTPMRMRWIDSCAPNRKAGRLLNRGVSDGVDGQQSNNGSSRQATQRTYICMAPSIATATTQLGPMLS